MTQQEQRRLDEILQKIGVDLEDYYENLFQGEEPHERDNRTDSPFDVLSLEELEFFVDHYPFESAQQCAQNVG
jgi:hypothetical protein